RIRIATPNSAAQRCGSGRGLDRRAHDEINGKSVLALRIWHVPNPPVDPIVEKIFLHVFDNADPGHPRKDLAGTNAPDPFANGIFPRPSLTRELLADNDHGQSFGAIILVDQPSLDQCNAKRLEIAWTHNPMRGDGNIIW